MPVRVTLHKVGNANDKQEKLIRRARALLEVAVNHKDFEKRVLTAPYRETLFRPRNGRRISKKPHEIAAIILAGLERDTATDREIDISLKLDNIEYPTVGSTTVGKLPWRTAYWFVDLCLRKNDTISPARHLIHEWLHVAGFVHEKNDGYRPDVPYLVGSVVRKILKQDAVALDAHEDPEAARELDAAREEIEEGKKAVRRHRVNA